MRYFLSLLFFPLVLFGEASTVKGYDIHEAYFSPDQSALILQAVPIKPPQDITERIPKNTTANAVWIPGYWSWSKIYDRYVWLSGTWRLAPPGHEWIHGKWKKFDEGWVWLSGFWSSHDEKDLSYINRPPPDNADEDVKDPPGSDYFWLPGHWRYDSDKDDFTWYMGRWQEFDKKWQYVPARYIWREKGYVFIEGFWDWSLESRGVAYAAVEIPEDEINTIAYMPRDIVEASEVIHIYYPYWPDYFMSFRCWFFFHPGFDFGWGDVPIWWNWPGWWAFNGVDMWWLWWWWSHPGFSHPFFLNADIAGMILPPDAMLLHRMQRVSPMPFIAPNGVVEIEDLIHAVENFTGHSEPIFPSSPEEVFEIQEQAHPTRRPNRVLKPSADNPPVTPPEKPFTGPSRDDFSQPIERTKTPSYPKTPVKHPPIQVVKPSRPVKPRARTYESEHEAPPEVPQAPQTRHEPPHRYLPRNNTRVRPPHAETYKPRTYEPQPRYTPPSQGYKPRKTPQTYEPQQPSKPRYQPRSQTAPHPTYTPPSKTPQNYNRYKTQ